VVADSGAPRGSLYFHFPGGKDELVGAAISQAGEAIDALIRGVDADDATDLVTILLTVLGQRLEQSSWSRGCPVDTVALETSASNDAIQKICSTAYASWHGSLRDKLRADGRDNADDVATLLLAALEGALLLARAHRSIDPLTAVGRAIKALL
jgi:TetR/AcrR family transcriptional repressor of lmrAB and yxaGH operons